MPDKPKLKHKVPKTVGGAIDLLAKLRKERQALTAKAEAVREQESLVERSIFDMFKKSELDGAKGKLATAAIKQSDVPVIENDVQLDKHVLKTGELDLFQRRLSVEACRERWKDGRKIPGVGIFTRVSLSLTMRK